MSKTLRAHHRARFGGPMPSTGKTWRAMFSCASEVSSTTWKMCAAPISNLETSQDDTNALTLILLICRRPCETELSRSDRSNRSNAIAMHSATLASSRSCACPKFHHLLLDNSESKWLSLFSRENCRKWNSKFLNLVHQSI